MSALAPEQAVLPLQALLRAYGHTSAAQALIAECAGDFSIASMAKCLERRGLLARVVRARGVALSELGCTLVELKDRTVVLLRQLGGTWRLELGATTQPLAPVDADLWLGGAAIEVSPPFPRDRGVLRGLWRYSVADRKLRAALWLFPASIVTFALLGFGVPALTRAIVDGAIPDGAERTLGVLVGAILGIGMLQTLAGNVKQRAALVMETRLSAAATQAVFATQLSMPLARLQKLSSGQVSQTLSSVSVVVSALTQHVLGGAIAWSLCTGYLIWLAVISWPVAVALVAMTAALLVTVVLWSSRLSALQRRQLDAAATEHDELFQLVDRIRVLRASAAVGWATSRWQRALRREQDVSVEHELSAGALGELLATVERLVVGGSVLWLTAACLDGKSTLGDLFVVVSLVAAFCRSQSELLLLLSQAQGIRAHLQRIDAVLGSRVELPHSQTGALRSDRGIIIDSVCFRYDERSPWILEDYSLTIRPGVIQNIEWPSGRGKTTLLRLIAGLYAPERGKIIVGGLDARAARQHITYIPQGCWLPAGSVLANLRLLSSGASRQRILEVAQLTGLTAAVAAWPMGLETLVTNGGRNLSSGQRQLIILTAALASPRAIILLDEATTHIDAVLRAGLARSGLLEGRTIVNVTHPAKRAAAKP
jgi:ATP-binding cassette subfamily B protein